jgi:hypothetical protein
MYVYKVDILSIAHLVLWSGIESWIGGWGAFTATLRVIGVVYNHQFEINIFKLKKSLADSNCRAV